jgi:hypothetical protein
MHLLQIRTDGGGREVAVIEGDAGQAVVLDGVTSVRELASQAIEAGATLADLARRMKSSRQADPAALLREGRVISPIDHPDPAHLYVTGTGLTHLGSAESRDSMHRDQIADADLTDSMRLFLMGREGGKPAPGQTGVQPEWFYKGNGGMIANPGAPLTSPDFALDGGEEPEIAGVYLIGPDGTPFRLGFTLANEFSDHVMERQNYLYLAHSKLRPCAIGPTLRLGPLPADVRGASRILRDGRVVWEREFLTGEDNMAHSIANLEAHHFKYPVFRQPGDIHVHFFGTATLSFTDGVELREGDVFEIGAGPFPLPLANPLKRVTTRGPELKAL